VFELWDFGIFLGMIGMFCILLAARLSFLGRMLKWDFTTPDFFHVRMVWLHDYILKGNVFGLSCLKSKIGIMHYPPDLNAKNSARHYYALCELSST